MSTTSSTATYSPRIAPDTGKTYWFYCSAKEPVLRAVDEWDQNLMTSTMRHDMDWIDKCIKYRRFEEMGKPRPCFVVSIHHGSDLPTVVPLATFGDTPISELDEYTQHWAVSVGSTPPWPPTTTDTVQTTPAWSHDRTYALLKPIRALPDQLIAHYHRDKYTIDNLPDIRFWVSKKDFEFAQKAKSQHQAHSHSYDVAMRREKKERRRGNDVRLNGVRSADSCVLDTIDELGAGDDFAETWRVQHSAKVDNPCLDGLSAPAGEDPDHTLQLERVSADIENESSDVVVAKKKRKLRLGRRERDALKAGGSVREQVTRVLKRLPTVF
ncbi:hypothetical protein EXIGLDRAFT_722399 [Exidia glandulosa HHB12029]|uniref:Uncharacterized protein n=1 Tax=Exidia glandulosa HHB12029 TaxID=1314781 RepID=A0A166A5R6_EXIGL|nr:hypothetical protein EXIGLDRAFT_722399 [Exidia glandulosa HHB12029]